MFRTNRPAPLPPKAQPNSRQSNSKVTTFNSFLSNDRNNNPQSLNGPTVIRPTTSFHKKKAPPPRPAPPKHYQGKQNSVYGSSQFSPTPDLLADLHDIFGPPQTKNSQKQVSKTVSALGSINRGSNKWKKAPAPPKPNPPKSSAEQFSLIDFDAFAPVPNISASSNQYKINQKAVDLLCGDPFGPPVPNTMNNTFLSNFPSNFQSTVNNSDRSVNTSAPNYAGAANLFQNSSSLFDKNPGFGSNSLCNQSQSVFNQAISALDQKPYSHQKSLFQNAVSSTCSSAATNSLFESSGIQKSKSQVWETTTSSSTPKNKIERSRSSIFSPPEPQFPPPPPPPDAYQTEFCECQALYDFTSADMEELTFSAGDIIILTEKVNMDWWRGVFNEKSGLFPASYVEVLSPSQENTVEDSCDSADRAKGCFVTALYDFDGEQSGDLTFRAGDSIEVLYRINQNWLFGKCNNREGQFPTNFVQKNGELDGTYHAQYDFKAETAEELSFCQGEVICVVEKVNSDWWKGYRQDDLSKRVGLFPATFVE